MLLKEFIEMLQSLDDTIEIKYGGANSEWYEPVIEPTEDNDNGEYYYRIVGK